MDATPDYVALARQQLGALRGTLLGQLERIEKAIAALELVPNVAATREQLGMDPSVIPPATPLVPPSTGEESDGKRGRFSGMRLTRATLTYLREHRELRTISEIAEALRLGGLHTSSPHIQANIHTTLRRLVEKGLVRKEGNRFAATEMEGE